MAAIWFRVNIWLRRHRGRVAVTALVVGIVVATALGLTAGTRRTGSAPDRFTAAAGGDPDLQITQLGGAPITQDVAAIDGVTSAKSLTFLLAFPLSPKDGSPLVDMNPFVGNDDVLGAKLVEGRFVDPDTAGEFTANDLLASDLKRRFGTKVGDRFTLVSYAGSQVEANVDLANMAPEGPSFEGRLVGITRSPSDFDESLQQMVFSRATLEQYSDVAVIQTIIAASHDSTVSDDDLTNAARGINGGTDLYTSTLKIVSDSARRAVSYQTFALWLVSGLAMLAAAVVTAQIAGRSLRLDEGERRAVTSLGWTGRQLAAERALEGAAIGLAAAPVAVVLGYLGTAAFPLGVLHTFEPDPGPSMDWTVTLLGALALVLVTTVAGAVIGYRERARVLADRTAVVPPWGGMPAAVGTHYATATPTGRRSWNSALLGSLGLAGLVGALIAGMSLTSAVDDGSRWGVTYDALYGNPYTPASNDIVTPVADIADTEAVTGATNGSLVVNGKPVASFAYETAKGQIIPRSLDGRAPTGDDEIGVGKEVQRRLDVGIGDTVQVTDASGADRPFKVVGTVVTPGNAGNGVVTTFAAYKLLEPSATQNFVLVDYRPGREKQGEAAVTDAIYTPPDALATPTTIKALERVTAAPFLLAVVIGFMLLASGAYLLTSSVRSRGRELGALRAMGSTRQQLRSVIHWQSGVIVAVTLLAGIPVGIAAGRLVVNRVISTLGIVPGTVVPVWLVVTAIVGALVVGNVIALMPARRATKLAVTAAAAR